MSGGDVVSVVLPFFDPDEGFLREAVESVRKQTYSHWELILVDDGSPPNAGASAARTLVASMPDRARLVTYDRPANRGASAARNQGLCHATARYVAFLDADDVRLSATLERELEALLRKPNRYSGRS
jgi:glycosyltransferase involved in cell wall biosynthesis